MNINFMKTLRSVIILLMCINTAYLPALSQSADIHLDTINLKQQAVEMASSFLKSDYPRFVKFTYPKLVAMMGGEEKMVSAVQTSMNQLKDQGFTIKSVDITLMPVSVKAGKEIHTLVSQSLTMDAPGGKLSSVSYLLAISGDGGKNWTFVDTTPLRDPAKMKMILPDYNFDLKIPEKQQPVFTKDESEHP